MEIKSGGEGKINVRVMHTGVALHYYGAEAARAKEPRKLLAMPATPDMTEYARSVPGRVEFA